MKIFNIEKLVVKNNHTELYRAMRTNPLYGGGEMI